MTLNIFKKYCIKAKKSLWQNFLVNEVILEEIVESVLIKWRNIVEVGPWYWALTEKIIQKKPKNLTLVELDNDMINIIKDRVKNKDLNIDWINFEIKNSDILEYEAEYKNYSVIANIPYYITSPILRHFLYKVENTPKSMLILMQNDVWDKILGWKKNKTSVLSLFITKKCFVKKILFVWKENFIPEPKVESSVLLFKKHDLHIDIEDEDFLRIIKIWFSEPRKKLIKNLIKWGFTKELIIQAFLKLWIEDNSRWEDLNISIWYKLIKEINI